MFIALVAIRYKPSEAGRVDPVPWSEDRDMKWVVSNIVLQGALTCADL